MKGPFEGVKCIQGLVQGPTGLHGKGTCRRPVKYLCRLRPSGGFWYACADPEHRAGADKVTPLLDLKDPTKLAKAFLLDVAVDQATDEPSDAAILPLPPDPRWKTPVRPKALTRAAIRAACARADAVRNRMASCRSRLRRRDMPLPYKANALLQIDAAWQALGGHGLMTQHKLAFISAIDKVASSALTAKAAGKEVVEELPSEMQMAFKAHIKALGLAVGAWRIHRAGRRPRSSPLPAKFDACAAVWNSATGDDVKPSAFKTRWNKRARASR